MIIFLLLRCVARTGAAENGIPVMAETVLFKKYANRRLYHTGRSAYVTLDEVAATIREGLRVQVLDARTGEDVTAFILTQIIVEQARNRNSLLPVPLLHLVIQYGDGVLGEFFEKYLELTVKNYLAYKTAFDEQFRKWLSMGRDISSVAQKSLPGFTPWDSLFDLFSNMDKERKEKQAPGGEE